MNVRTFLYAKLTSPSCQTRRQASRNVAFPLQLDFVLNTYLLVMRSDMKRNKTKPARNRDRVRSRQNEISKPDAIPERNRGERDRNAPLPEEETYEREPRNRSRNEQM